MAKGIIRSGKLSREGSGRISIRGQMRFRIQDNHQLNKHVITVKGAKLLLVFPQSSVKDIHRISTHRALDGYRTNPKAASGQLKTSVATTRSGTRNSIDDEHSQEDDYELLEAVE